MTEIQPDFAAIALSVTPWVHGQVSLWTNSAGGYWTNAANWQSSLLPGPGTDATINANGTYTNTMRGTGTVQSIANKTATVLTNGASLALNGPYCMQGAGSVLRLQDGNFAVGMTNGTGVAAGKPRIYYQYLLGGAQSQLGAGFQALPPPGTGLFFR